jgi:hypothetical protein
MSNLVHEDATENHLCRSNVPMTRPLQLKTAGIMQMAGGVDAHIE